MAKNRNKKKLKDDSTPMDLASDDKLVDAPQAMDTSESAASRVSVGGLQRSSVEEMLDSLRRRHESDKPKDIPPALPSLPKLTSRARLPSSKRPLPTSIEAGETNEAGKLTRRHFVHLQSSKALILDERKRGRKLSEVMGFAREDLPSVVEELQKRVSMAEANLGKKEKENAALREQVEEFEARWLEYEAKMKSMEDTWQKQMVSLQTNLAAAKKSLGAERAAVRPGRLDGLTSPGYYDSEETMAGGTRTPTPGASTPMKPANNGLNVGNGRETSSELNSVGHMAKEFDHRKQTFDDDVKAIVEVKSGHNSVEELRTLKHRFETWKKDFKARLREAKAKLLKVGNLEGEKRNKKWWGKNSIKFVGGSYFQ